MLLAGCAVPNAGTVAARVNWPSYLYSPQHTSVSPATAVTAANAGSLARVWRWKPSDPAGTPGDDLISSPTVVNGVVYIGADNGVFYALNEATGTVKWKDTIGFVTHHTCDALGFASTAAVAPDPVTGTETVYVNAPNGYLYALNAATGATIWKAVVDRPSTTKNDYFAWSSPTVANGRIYLGISSECDVPLVRAGLLAFRQHTGAKIATFYTVPAGSVGGSIWSSAAVAPSGTVYVTTGNGPTSDELLGTSEAIAALNGTTLALIGSWQIAAHVVADDSDFGGSPTLFTATLAPSVKPTEMVGACNKNGYYYALARDDLLAGPVWSLQVGAVSNSTNNDECISAAVWNGNDLFIAGPPTSIDGTAYNGSLREVNPANGQIIWATGLPGDVDGSPAMDASGVLSVATYDFSGAPNADYLVSARTGDILATLSTNNSPEFPQPVYADRYLMLATNDAGLIVYRAPG
jgi:outer membrane protein assembly factor BamB